ncbi:hypothetical protein FGO68_gene6236 [Halteria grandinella]|uniref:Uncharacterized protein n=1 Tax=Halteria grandinella TaxID=5974 RepID=A0A8J8SX95_HALGN|nr:hypothetical protein FGO68_gene6236 [Halteria grandinella]
MPVSKSPRTCTLQLSQYLQILWCNVSLNCPHSKHCKFFPSQEEKALKEKISLARCQKGKSYSIKVRP